MKKEIFKKLKTDIDGLSEKEVKNRLEKYGLNELPKEKAKTLYQIFLSSLKDPIIYVLIVASFLSLIVGEYIDGIAIFIIILIDAIVSTIQEYSANKNSEALRSLIKVLVKTVRNGKYYEVDSEYIVPGDIVIIEPGSKVAGDMYLLKATNIAVDESVLTGESIAVNKNDILNEKNIENTSCVLHAGSTVLTGYGMAVVVNTGINTEIGKIALKVTDTEASKSPLTIRMEKFSKQITIIIVVISLIIGGILMFGENDAFEIFLSVIALSVSAMPEGLPLALTLALTIGSNRMGKRNVIVKKLNAVESLGSCTVIASDKTGTLTVNEQTAKKILLPSNEEFEISGNGYNDDGRIICKNKSNLTSAKNIALLGLINNESSLTFENNKWNKMGDSIDIAFKSLAYKAKCNDENIEKIHTIHYESENKYSAVFYKDKEGIKCTAKGSVEVILDFCDTMLKKDKKVKIDKDIILAQNNELASCGYRVIALCNGKVKGKDEFNEKDINELSFMGLVAFIDPVRNEVSKSIKKCKHAGVNVIMITGDHALTAYAIGKELNMVNSLKEVVTGDDLSLLIDNEVEFDKFIRDKKVFARVTPIQKLKIVESLQRMGEFVAVTGDGVNDAPALKVANIGVSMGSGTDVAKETANMIIIDDNFNSIVAGIEEGRNAYSNIRKISILLLSCGFAEVLFFVLSIIFGLPMPLVAIQLIWLNIVTDGLQDMALSFENEKDTLMHEKPRSTKESLFEKELIKQVMISGLFMGILVFIVWVILLKIFNMNPEIARGYILILMVFIQNMHVLNCRSETKSVFNNSLSSNKFVILTIIGSILLQIIFMEVPVLSMFLKTKSINPLHILILFVVSSPVLFVMELYKYIKNLKQEEVL